MNFKRYVIRFIGTEEFTAVVWWAGGWRFESVSSLEEGIAWCKKTVLELGDQVEVVWEK